MRKKKRRLMEKKETRRVRPMPRRRRRKRGKSGAVQESRQATPIDHQSRKRESALKSLRMRTTTGVLRVVTALNIRRLANDRVTFVPPLSQVGRSQMPTLHMFSTRKMIVRRLTGKNSSRSPS